MPAQLNYIAVLSSICSRVAITIMNYIVLPTLILLFTSSIVNSIVFSVPHQLASLFRMEEKLVSKLKMATSFYNSDTLDLYLSTCEPRFAQLASLSDLTQV